MKRRLRSIKKSNFGGSSGFGTKPGAPVSKQRAKRPCTYEKVAVSPNQETSERTQQTQTNLGGNSDEADNSNSSAAPRDHGSCNEDGSPFLIKDGQPLFVKDFSVVERPVGRRAFFRLKVLEVTPPNSDAFFVFIPCNRIGFVLDQEKCDDLFWFFCPTKKPSLFRGSLAKYKRFIDKSSPKLVLQKHEILGISAFVKSIERTDTCSNPQAAPAKIRTQTKPPEATKKDRVDNNDEAYDMNETSNSSNDDGNGCEENYIQGNNKEEILYFGKVELSPETYLWVDLHGYRVVDENDERLFVVYKDTRGLKGCGRKRMTRKCTNSAVGPAGSTQEVSSASLPTLNEFPPPLFLGPSVNHSKDAAQDKEDDVSMAPASTNTSGRQLSATNLVDSIENNMESAYINTSSGHNELPEPSDHANRSVTPLNEHQLATEQPTINDVIKMISDFNKLQQEFLQAQQYLLSLVPYVYYDYEKTDCSIPTTGAFDVSQLLSNIANLSLPGHIQQRQQFQSSTSVTIPEHSNGDQQ